MLDNESKIYVLHICTLLYILQKSSTDFSRSSCTLKLFALNVKNCVALSSYETNSFVLFGSSNWKWRKLVCYGFVERTNESQQARFSVIAVRTGLSIKRVNILKSKSHRKLVIVWILSRWLDTWNWALSRWNQIGRVFNHSS